VQHDEPAEFTGQTANSSHFHHSSRAAFAQQEAEVDRMQLNQQAQAGGQSFHANEFRPSVGSASVQQGRQRQPMGQEQFTNSRDQPFGVSGVRSVELESRQQDGHFQSVEQRHDIRCNLTSSFNASGMQPSSPGDMQQSEERHVVQQNTQFTRERAFHSVYESSTIQAPMESNGQSRSTSTDGRPASQSRRLRQTKLVIRSQPQVAEQHVQATG
jgi:hypothetical protein